MSPQPIMTPEAAMTIEWRAADRQFHLSNGLISLVLRVYEDGSLGHLHLGGPLPIGRTYRHLGPDPFDGFANRVGSPVPFAYPTPGAGDYRVPALVAAGDDGASALSLRYQDHHIARGKPSIDPLPSTYVEDADEAETLVVTLVDEPTGLEVDLRFTIFAGRPVIARSATIRAAGAEAIELRTAMSLALDLPDADWVMVGLTGAWAREAHVVERMLVPGRQSASSTRGASGAQHNPLLVLRRPTADEAQGEVVGFSLIYSGNFLVEVEVEPFGTTRVRVGIEPETFGWHLEPGDAFTSPEGVIVVSQAGLGGLSDAFHDLYRDRLARGTWRDRPRPILINNWEATYFDFDADRLVEIARSACELGVELFVLDDGWFGHRDDDTTSLGDWVVDRRKLPDGLGGIAERITALGLSFGLWIEPEMVSADSDLFRARPDWAIGIPGRPRTESRQQLVLDLAGPRWGSARRSPNRSHSTVAIVGCSSVAGSSASRARSQATGSASRGWWWSATRRARSWARIGSSTDRRRRSVTSGCVASTRTRRTGSAAGRTRPTRLRSRMQASVQEQN